MKIIKFKIFLIVLIIFSIIFLPGCWSDNEVDALAINISMGIDKTKNGYLITTEILNPKAIASKQAANQSPIFIYTEEGKDIEEAIRKFTTQTSRKMFSKHLRMVVLGESVAKDGIKDILEYFMRSNQFRTDYYFVIARGSTAKDILSILTPIESIPGIELYKSLKISEDNWASTKSMKIIELVNDIAADGINPVLTGIKITEGEPDSDSTEAVKKSNQIKKTEYAYLGAFEKDKLIGWLNEDESKGYNYITGNVKNTTDYTYYGENIKVTYNIISEKSKIKASLVNNKPSIKVQIKIKANITAVEGEFDVSKEENKIILSSIVEEKEKLFCTQALTKARDLSTDIFGFGEAIHRQYPKEWEKIKNDWNNEFAALPVDITVNVTIHQIGQITKPLFSKEKE